MELQLHFDEADWERIERDYSAWWAHELPRPIVQIGGWDGTRLENPLPSFMSNVPFDVSAEEIVERAAESFRHRYYYGDDFPHWWINFGPGMVAGLLGAVVHSVEETVWFEPPGDTSIEGLSFAYQPDNPWWQRILAITRAGAQAFGQMVQVSHTDLGGNLDILASFTTTQQLLTDLYDHPETVERLALQITELWKRYYDELDAIIYPACRGRVPWTPIWSTGRCYMMQCDFAYMISPEMFDRFVMPDLVALCDHLAAGFYHLDGQGQIPHLDSLLSIERLRGIQWVPGDGSPTAEHWLDLYQRIRNGGKLCQFFCTPEAALQIVSAIGGKDIMFSVSGSMDAEQARAFLDEMRQRDVWKY
ncbi:MAG: hypothetical protein GXY52_06950 [Chloroflexi bacterium]|nr:hypothetical protein [Chloroflexota bacterium]